MSHEATLLESVTTRITAKMLATSPADFMTPKEMAKHKIFTKMPHFNGFTFHQESNIGHLNSLSGTVGMSLLNSDIKEDHSYTFFPDLGERVSPMLILSILKVLHSHGYHVATAYHQMIFGIKTPD